MRSRCFIIFSVLLLAGVRLHSQMIVNRKYIDSLQKETQKGINDTNAAICYFRLCWELRFTDSDSARMYGEKALNLATGLNFQRGIGSSYNNLGGVYEAEGDDWNALRYYLRALDVKRSLNDERSIASTLNNIGVVYKKQDDFGKAIAYFREALRINLKSGNHIFELFNYRNLASAYRMKKDFDSCDYFLDRSKELADRIGKEDFLYDVYMSRGNLLLEMKQFKSALAYYDTAYTYAVKYNITHEEYFSNKGQALIELKQYDSARVYLLTAWNLKKNTADWQVRNTTSSGLYEYYLDRHRKTGSSTDLDSAVFFMQECYSSRDSIMSFKRSKSIGDLVTNSVIEQKNREVDTITKEKELSDVKAKGEHQFVLMLSIIMILVVLLTIFTYNRFRKTRILSHQLAAKNKEITDSIHYARRIQQSLLPSDKYIERVLKQKSGDGEPEQEK